MSKRYFDSPPPVFSLAAEELKSVPVQAVGDDRRRRLHGHQDVPFLVRMTTVNTEVPGFLVLLRLQPYPQFLHVPTKARGWKMDVSSSGVNIDAAVACSELMSQVYRKNGFSRNRPGVAYGTFVRRSGLRNSCFSAPWVNFPGNMVGTPGQQEVERRLLGGWALVCTLV